MKILKFIKPYLAQHKGKVCVYIILSILLWLLSLATPYSIGYYLDVLLSTQNTSAIWTTIMMLAFFWTLQIVFSYVKNLILTVLHSRICFQINADLLGHITRLPIRFFSEKNHAYLNQRISSDCKIITGYALGDVQLIISCVLTIVFTGIIVYSLNWGIFLILSILLPLYAILYIVFKKPLYQLRYSTSEEYSRYYAVMDKVLGNIKQIKLQEWHTRFFKRLSNSFQNFHAATVKSAKLGYVFSNIDTLIRYLANMTIFVYAGYQILEGGMTVGEFTMVNSYSVLVISCMSSILQFGKSYQQTAVSYDRIQELYQRSKETSGSIKISSVVEIAAENLSFSYEDKAVLRNVNFVLKKGNIHAVVGENGAGKSTLINILSGLEQEYEGKLTYNGLDIRILDQYHLRKYVLSIVEQEPELIFELLKENLVDTEVSDEEINQWLEKFKLQDLTLANENVRSHIGTDSHRNWSGGEKQKISIIRCLLKNADVIILDEPNSAFDDEGTRMLCEILQKIKVSKIIVVVTHRAELINISDSIIRL